MFKDEVVFITLFGVTLLVILSIVFLFIIFNNKKNKLLQQNLEAQLKSQKRQHQIELKALRSQMNPHFVHNSLNAIQYYIQQNDVETSEKYLAKFSKLMRQFFDFSRQQTICIRDEMALLNNYLYIEKLRFEDKLEYSITANPNLNTEDEFLPSMLLQPIVENAINHGLFHKKGVGKVTIQFSPVNSGFKVTITDNGIGINKAKQMKTVVKSKKEAHSSEVLEERLQFLNKSGNFNIDFSIIDLSETQNTTGTEVALTFKQTQNDTY